MKKIEEVIQDIKDKAHICMQDAYDMGVQDERERIIKLLNVQEDEQGDLYIELDKALKESLGL